MSPSPSPVSSPDPVQEIGLGKDGPSCTGNSFHAELKVKVGGVGQSGIKIKFSYKAEQKEATTNSNGVAGADFEFKGNGDITASADGYPSQTIGVESPKDCSNVGGDTNKVLGVSITNEQVLGASTMADTGNGVADLFNLVFGLGAGLMGLGVNRYARKN